MMMVPDYRRRCSAAEFANKWLVQQQAKQQHVRGECSDVTPKVGAIHTGRDQGAALMVA